MKRAINCRILIVVTFSLIFGLTALSSTVRSETVGFDSDRWTVLGGQVTEHLGRTAFEGTAVLEDVELENGIIEFDVAVTSDRKKSYPGILFHIQEQNSEQFYIRPHRSALYNDVLQYTPSFSGVASWQLYSGDGYTETATIPVGQWIHFKVIISGTQAQVFMENDNKPALSIPELKLGKGKGPIGVSGPAGGISYFSNFSYIIDPAIKIDPIPKKEPAFGVIKNWQLSEPVNRLEVDIEKTPEQQGLNDLMWKDVVSEPDGLVDIGRYYLWNYMEANLVWAKTTITSPEDQLRQFSFGYSDAVDIFLNGQLLFSGVSTYQGRDPSFLGIIGYNDAVYLPLKKGDNELVFGVVETFGGWGFMCRDADTVFLADGITESWEIKKEMRMPESAVYDPTKDILYVTNYFNNGQEFISKVTLDGQIQELKFVEGLNRPTGINMFKDKLYVVERTNLAEIDKESGKILNRYPIPNPSFPNDLTFDENGIGYLTDNDGSNIYKFSKGEFTVWLQSDEVIEPNGLLYNSGKLIVGCTGDGTLKSIDIATKKITPIVSLGAGSIMDGITSDGKGNFIISDFYGRIFRVNSAGEKKLLINSNSARLLTADISYIPEKNMLIVPRLYNSKLAAYTISQ